jgi:hypothetical protein
MIEWNFVPQLISPFFVGRRVGGVSLAVYASHRLTNPLRNRPSLGRTGAGQSWRLAALEMGRAGAWQSRRSAELELGRAGAWQSWSLAELELGRAVAIGWPLNDGQAPCNSGRNGTFACGIVTDRGQGRFFRLTRSAGVVDTFGLCRAETRPTTKLSWNQRRRDYRSETKSRERTDPNFTCSCD